MASGDPVYMNSQRNPGDLSAQGYDFGIGDNGSIHMQNPGMVDIHNVNPAAAGFIDQLGGLSKQFNDTYAQNFLNNDYYNKMTAESGQRAQTAVDNNFSRMGLAGSSAAMGAGMEAQRQNQMGWDQRRLSDMLSATGMMSKLGQVGLQGTMGIQNQYSGFQNSMADAYINMLNAQQGQANGTNNLIGGIAGGVASGGGMALGALL